MKKLLFIFLLYVFMPGSLFAGDRVIDSLLSVLKTEKEDTSKINTLTELAWDIQFTNPDTAILIGKQALALSKANNSLAFEAKSENCLGVFYKTKGDYMVALDHFNRSLALSEMLEKNASPEERKELLKHRSATIGNMGVVYYEQGNYPKALEYYSKAFDIATELGKPEVIENTLGNIGIVYFKEAEYDKAQEYFQKSLDKAIELKDKDGMARQYGNIGNVYSMRKDSVKALEYNSKALKLSREIDDKNNEALWLGNMGDIYMMSKNYVRAMGSYDSALAIYEKLGDKDGMTENLANTGELYFKQGNYEKAQEYLDKAMKLARELGSLSLIKDIHYDLYQLDSAKKDWLGSLDEYKKYTIANDSLFNQETTKKVVREQMNYEFKAEQEKKDALQQEQTRKQQLTIYFISGILLLALAFAFFAYRNSVQRRKANRELSLKNQKIETAYNIIEEKNHEITDSINYAKRIQQAILPDLDLIRKALPQSFVLFKPKDIVSGDFYFFHYTKDMAFIAAADCTGHGVPGAFMSMIGSEKLNEAVTLSNDAGKILSIVNNGIRSSLHQSDETDSTRDGMDIALCTLKGNKLQYAGANRPLWIIRNGATVIEEYKATKKAIGGFTEENQVFENTEVTLNAGDTFYIFTDGYADQFGGENGKKLTTRKFKDLLFSVKDKAMDVQLAELDSFIEKWKSDREQLDDILVIGIRV